MTAAGRLPVLVGVDGSEASRAAIEVGVGAARRWGRPLRLVHVSESGDGETVVDHASASDDAEALLADALAYAAAAAPDVAVTAEVIPGDVVPTLLAEARQAALLVVGERGRGGFAGLLLGSVASHLAAHATGPVIVARETPRPDGPVVVGADGSPGSAPAVEFAFAEAAARGAELVAIRTWHGRVPRETEENLPLIYDAEDVQADQARRLTASLTPVRDRYPQVVVRERVRHGRAARVLVEESATAQLLVVGARGRGGFAALPLGSVGQAVLRHAHCPVAIVHPPGTRRE